MSPATDWSPTEERIRWVGKPWRRVEWLSIRHFYKGEQVGRNDDVSVHIGLRRLGLSLTLIFGKHDCLDYSEERP